MDKKYSLGYALVVGVGSDLPVTVNDAAMVARFLRDPERCAYPPEQVSLLVSEDANRNRILSALAELVEQTIDRPDSTVFVYFSGHGVYSPAYYLLPFGYDIDNLDSTAIAESELTAALRQLRSKKLIVVLDCCHAGGFGDVALPETIEKGPPPPSLMDALKEGGGRVIIASSRKDEESLILKGNSNSVFTMAFLEAIAGLGTAERDGYVRIADIITYVSRLVPNRTEQRQNPMFKFQRLDNFVVAYYAGGDIQVKVVDWLAPMPKPSQPAPSQAECASWRRQLAKRRESLLLIEERMAEYVLFSDIPLLLIKEKRRTESAIAELDQKLLAR